MVNLFSDLSSQDAEWSVRGFHIPFLRNAGDAQRYVRQRADGDLGEVYQ
jgi:hypothetical protein